MCEPLIGKKKRRTVKIHTGTYNESEVFAGYSFDYKDVKSAVKFFKKYANSEILFKQDFPEYIWIKIGKFDFEHGFSKYRDFKDWLFDYCFGDVI